MTQAPSKSGRLKRAVLFSLLILAASLAVALEPDWLDRPLAKAINVVAGRSQVVDRLAFVLASPTLQTGAVVFLAWLCWRSQGKPELPARLATGAVAAVGAAMAAHLLNLALPTPPKPIFDPAIDLHPVAVLGDIGEMKTTAFVASHSFPSPRATLFAGLAIAVALVRPRLGAVALVCTLLPELSRIALGLHYPADIVGSFALAAAFVQLAQLSSIAPLGLWVVGWEKRFAPMFYLSGLLACYQLTGGFQDLRDLAGQWLR